MTLRLHVIGRNVLMIHNIGNTLITLMLCVWFHENIGLNDVKLERESEMHYRETP